MVHGVYLALLRTWCLFSSLLVSLLVSLALLLALSRGSSSRSSSTGNDHGSGLGSNVFVPTPQVDVGGGRGSRHGLEGFEVSIAHGESINVTAGGQVTVELVKASRRIELIELRSHDLLQKTTCGGRGINRSLA